jgi:hypothetical protein
MIMYHLWWHLTRIERVVPERDERSDDLQIYHCQLLNSKRDFYLLHVAHSVHPLRSVALFFYHASNPALRRFPQRYGSRARELRKAADRFIGLQTREG